MWVDSTPPYATLLAAASGSTQLHQQYDEYQAQVKPLSMCVAPSPPTMYATLSSHVGRKTNAALTQLESPITVALAHKLTVVNLLSPSVGIMLQPAPQPATSEALTTLFKCAHAGTNVEITCSA
jgi:hypothetical protein